MLIRSLLVTERGGRENLLRSGAEWFENDKKFIVPYGVFLLSYSDKYRMVRYVVMLMHTSGDVMCSNLNFTKINRKAKGLVTSIFVRFGSGDVKKERVVTVPGGGIQKNNGLKAGQNEKSCEALHCAGSSS